jgi:hypothetical protein
MLCHASSFYRDFIQNVALPPEAWVIMKRQRKLNTHNGG